MKVVKFSEMRILVVPVLLILKVILTEEAADEDVTSTEGSFSDLLTCYDSSCNYEKTEETTETTAIIQTERSTTKILTTMPANTGDVPRQSTLTENQSQDKTTKDKAQKSSPAEIPKKPKPKPKTKPKEDKSKIKPNKTAQNKNFNVTKQDDKFVSKPKNLNKVKSCNCDTYSGICEINCCCDEDCTKDNKKAFSHCEDESNYIFRSDYCFSPNVIYKNNTPFKAFNLRPGLLCIAKDNLPDKIKYYTHRIIETEDKIEKIIKRRKIYQWKTKLEDLDLQLDEDKPYSYGSPVWILKNSSNELSLQKLSIAHEGVTSLCQGRYQVGYLENTESSCLVKGPTSEASCIDLFEYNAFPHTDLHVLKSPHLINSSTDLQEILLEELFIKVQNFICFNEKCAKSVIDFTKFDRKTKTCNTIKKVSYLVKHNGTDGIKDIHCFVHVESVMLQSGMLRQQFEIKFDWINKVNSSFPRSGKPGYLSSKPLISSNRTEKMEDDKKMYMFNVSHNPNDWLTKIEASRDGFCNKRSNIMFNDNIKAGCTLKIQNNDMNAAENCSLVHEKVIKYYFGKMEGLDNIWLSSWGDPNKDDKNSWVPLVFTNEDQIPSCTHLITSIQYNFIYSLSGPLDSPQAKLIGAVVETNTSPFRCDSTECLVTLVTHVTFTSVTPTPRLLYPKHPALRIHLPKDFFYPFSSSSTASCLTYNFYILISIICFTSTLFSSF